MLERKPILLSKNTVAFIQIFDKLDDIEDVMFGVWDFERGHDGEEVWEEAAEEFVKQLKDKWCIRFLRALIIKCQRVIAEHQKVIKEHLEEDKECDDEEEDE